jgi:hypothetical protein
MQVFFHSQTDEDLTSSNLTLQEINLINVIRNDIIRVNPFVKSLSQILDVTGVLRGNCDHLPYFKMVLSDQAPNDHHPGRYNQPTCTQVAAIITGDEDNDDQPFQRQVVVHLRSRGSLTDIDSLHFSYDPLAYTLTHMHGEVGWSFNIPKVKRDLETFQPQFNHSDKVTQMDYYSYRGQIRDKKTLCHIDQDILLKGGTLMQQFWCDMWIKLEQYRLKYIREHQKE